MLYHTVQDQNVRNKLGEDRLSEADIADTMADVLVPDYKTPSDIKDAWTKILFNQFHDILPGSSIKEVYDDSKEEYEAILSANREYTDRRWAVWQST